MILSAFLAALAASASAASAPDAALPRRSQFPPGFLWGAARQQMLAAHGPIVFAHSDMSGLSIFEEACTRGVQAAEALLPRLSARR